MAHQSACGQKREECNVAERESVRVLCGERSRGDARRERDELRVAGETTVGEWREVVCDLVCDCDLRDEWVLFGLGLIESGHWFVR